MEIYNRSSGHIISWYICILINSPRWFPTCLFMSICQNANSLSQWSKPDLTKVYLAMFSKNPHFHRQTCSCFFPPAPESRLCIEEGKGRDHDGREGYNGQKRSLKPIVVPQSIRYMVWYFPSGKSILMWGWKGCCYGWEHCVYIKN